MECTEIIILNLTKLRENSVVLHTLSAEYGRRSFIAGVTKGTAMAKFLPLNILEAEVVENTKSDLWRVRNISVKYPLNSIRTNIYKNTMTLFMSEVLYRIVRDGVNEDGLFEWCERNILTLEAIESDFSNYHLRFLLELSAALGFSPSLEDLLPFAGHHLDEIRKLLELSLPESMLVPLNGAGRTEIAESLLDYLSRHTETALNIQSLKVLSEIFR
ncbi:MAG: DNA repair protein RecO [Bacteroidales bacterium]|nr:DNA repair protein RecO [Bacteroidales bacterium]